MRSRVLTFASIAAIIVALFGLTALAQDAWDIHKATYKGYAMCKMCHQNIEKSKAFVPLFDKTAHPKAMQKASAEGAIVGDFSAAPFAKDKVAWVLGRGRNKQAYLDANFQVLPGMWDVKEKKWKPATAADGTTQCIACHTTGFDPATKQYVAEGVQCESCHGPGGDHMAKMGKKEFILNPNNLDKQKQAMVCGQCHSAGKDPTGKFAHPVGFRPGDDLTKFFVDAKPTAPGNNQQYSEYITSRHALVGINCETCHDPHTAASGKSQLKKPVNELCLGCHAGKVTDLKTHAPQAAADATCASCHMPEGQHTFKKATK